MLCENGWHTDMEKGADRMVAPCVLCSKRTEPPSVSRNWLLYHCGGDHPAKNPARLDFERNDVTVVRPLAQDHPAADP